MSKTSKLLHLDPVAIALEKKEKAARESMSPLEAKQPALQHQGGSPPPAHPQPIPGPIAPIRDYNKRANSIEREAVPSGMFPGGSKKLYDALYLRTRGAIKPAMSVRAKKREMMEWAAIRNEKTIEAHLKHLTTVGLLQRSGSLGDNDGFTYRVILPDELGLPPSPPPAHPQPTTGQKMDLGTGQKIPPGGLGYDAETSITYSQSKTSSKTNTNDDEVEALSDLQAVFREAARTLTGRDPKAAEREQWAEVGRVIVGELKEAAGRAGTVSSVPAFLAEHLKRRFSQKPGLHKGEGKSPAAVVEISAQATTPDPDRRATPAEIAEQSRIIAELLESGYTLEQAEEQFAASAHPDDWAAILEAARAQPAREK